MKWNVSLTNTLIIILEHIFFHHLTINLHPRPSNTFFSRFLYFPCYFLACFLAYEKYIHIHTTRARFRSFSFLLLLYSFFTFARTKKFTQMKNMERRSKSFNFLYISFSFLTASFDIIKFVKIPHQKFLYYSSFALYPLTLYVFIPPR